MIELKKYRRSFLIVLSFLFLITGVGTLGCGDSKKAKPSDELAKAWRKKKKNARPPKKKKPKKVQKKAPPKPKMGAEVKIGDNSMQFDNCFIRFVYVDETRGGVVQIGTYDFEQAPVEEEECFFTQTATQAKKMDQLSGAILTSRFFAQNDDDLFSNIGQKPTLVNFKVIDDLYHGTIRGAVVDVRKNSKQEVEINFRAKELIYQ